MASLALGAIGGLIGGPIGYMIGSTIGNLLFPPKGPDGPRLSDLKFQGSSYGYMIPIVYGSFRVPGIVAWADDLVEHSHHSGGKGGPSSTTYTYTESFAIKLCKGPLESVRRIWADSTLIYSTVEGEDAGAAPPITIYLGVETANPDPTMEAILGVGNVPAFRDDAAIVFTDFDLSNYGNRMPNLNFEVVQNAGPIPIRISTFTTVSDHGAAYISGASLLNGVITLATWVGGVGVSGYTLDTYQLDGTHIAQTAAVSVPNVVAGSFPQEFAPCTNDPRIAYGVTGEAGNEDVSSWYVGGLKAGGPVAPPLGTTDSQSIHTPVETSALVRLDDNLFAIGGAFGNAAAWVSRYPCPDGIPLASPNAFYILSSSTNASNAGDFSVTVSDDGFVWVAGDDGHTTSSYVLFKFDTDLNLVHGWTKSEIPDPTIGTAALPAAFSFVVYRGYLYWQVSDEGEHRGVLYQVNGTTIERVNAIPAAVGNAISLGDGLVLGPDGVVSLNPPVSPVTLAAIVADVSTRCGQSAYDVAQLTDLVDGYAITQQADGRNAITPLQTAYFFDAVESSTSVKFVKRGGAVAATIPDGDLAAYQSGEPPVLLGVLRAQEEDLPAIFDYSYVNKDAAYQTGNQVAQLQVTKSQQRIAVQAAIAMGDAKAKEIVEKQLANAQIEREKYSITVGRPYSYLEPTDVVSVKSVLARLTTKNEQSSFILKFDGLGTHQSIYLGAFVSGTSSGFVPTTPPGAVVTTTTTAAQLLDIPLIDDGDSGPGFYVAATRALSLYKSTDGGVTYALIASVPATTIGSATTVLGDWSGANIIDEADSVTVVLVSGTLTSATELAVLNGANEALLGSEIIQFKNATLTGTNTYVLSGLLRGRRGTEFTTGTHAAAERFVLLPVTDIAGSLSEINQSRTYKAVGAGETLAGASPITFTNTGVGLRPYSPVFVDGGPDSSGNVIITWVRRTRTGGAWSSGVDVSVGESTESYVVQIWDSTYTTCARVISGLTSPTCTYTSAQQVIDFGANQQTIYVTVGQLGQVGLGVQTHAAIPGAGGSNTSPLTPTQPYGYIPPVTTGCTLPVTNSTITWSSPTTQTNIGFTSGTDWVISFTTPSSFGSTTNGTLSGAEYPVDGSQPMNRHATLSTGPCGSPLTTGSQVQGVTITIPFFPPGLNPLPTYYPTLQPSTKYYLTISTDDTSTMFVNLVHN